MAVKDEFEFISKIKPKEIFQDNLLVGIGDDAAIYRPAERMEQVVCLDTMVEGIHFLKGLSSPYEIGYKALAINISDIAAMGGIPKYYLISIAIPNSWSEADLYCIYDGLNDIAAHFRIDLIGGDTVGIEDKLVISVTVLGEVEQSKMNLRSNAKPGDVVFTTGSLGDSAAGLSILLNKNDKTHTEDETYLINRHKLPSPQVMAGRLITKLDRASLNDISDGLASELYEIAEASNVLIKIDESRIPISSALLNFKENPYEYALYGGEDFELVGTISRDSWNILKQECEKCSIQITQIGEVVSGEAKVLLTRENETVLLEKSGYNHFKK
ncbi:thiamine-phosphate kinase [Metabacillus fastidiosus]|uniref:thiamine-phosphate kinase n=1 Tax=Metabacillus fastidiosus TaxID=1458 RepID=UPI003D2AA97D